MGALIVGRRYSTLISVALAAILGGASGPALAAAQSGAAARPGNVTIYLAPVSKGGNDSHTGLTESSPLLDLPTAQKVLQKLNPTGNVTIRIEQGTYPATGITWFFYVPGHTISFMPVDYTGGGRPAGGDPVFSDPVNPKTKKPYDETWFTAQEPGSPSPLSDGGNTGLHFYYLQVQNYPQGISFNGQTGHSWHNKIWYIDPSKGVNDNAVSGMTFNDIGDTYAPGWTPTGVILLTDSSHNDIANNTFSNINNTGNTDELHAIYDTHFSSYNTIEKNLFEYTDGEAVKVRDRSDFNNVTGNRFVNTGGVAAYLDDFCNEACVQAARPFVTYDQCASYGNRFTDNTIIGGLPVYKLIPPGETYAGDSPCSIPKGQERLYLHGNG
jgi:hypothetical protein